MDQLRVVLQSVGVWDWLRDRYPSLSEDELMNRVENDFFNMIGEMLYEAE